MLTYKEDWPIKDMTKMLGVTRSGYYKYSKRRPSKWEKENSILLEIILNIFEKSHQTYGSPRVQAELKAQGLSCSRKRVARIMQKAGLAAKMRQSFRRTTRVDGRRKAAPNLLEQDFSAAMPNQKWVADITYVKTLEGWLYVSIILDLFSRKVIGLAMGATLQTGLVLQTLHQALQRRKPKNDLQHHSDRGCQYTSEIFQKLLEENNITCSMSGTGNCYDNAVAESFFHTLKTECVNFEDYETREQAKQSIFEYIEVFYNNQRRHSTLGYCSPAEFERRFYQPLCS